MVTPDDDEEAFDDIFSDEEPSEEAVVEEAAEPEAPEPEPVVEEVPEPEVEAVAETPQEPEPTEPEKPAHSVPLPELLETRKAKQAAEDQLRARDAELAALKAQFNGFQQALNAKQAPQQPETPVDFYEDPEAALKSIEGRVSQQFEDRIAKISYAAAQRHYGKETVDQALHAAINAGLGGQFENQPDPVGAAVEWFQERQIVETTGGNLEKYRETILAEEREKMKAELLAEIGVTPAESNGAKPPPSLTKTPTAGNKVEPVMSDSEAFNDIFAP